MCSPGYLSLLLEAGPGRIGGAITPQFDGLVEEEDSYLSLSAEPVVDFAETPAAHAVRVMTAARDAEEAEPGTVIVRQGYPLKLLAFIHRLHVSPTR